MNEQKKELMLKAAVKFKGVWPDDATHLLTTGKNWGGSPIAIGDVEPAIFNCFDEYLALGAYTSFRDGDDAWVVLCTRAEFEAFVESLFEGAPEDAEYYAHPNNEAYDVGFYKRENGVCFFASALDRDGWWRVGDTTGHNLIPRPPKKQAEAVERGGEGLPPVGAVCEYANVDHDVWAPCKILYKSSDAESFVSAMCQLSGGVEAGQVLHSFEYKFRPIKTESEKERERLDAFESIMDSISTWDVKCDTLEESVDDAFGKLTWSELCSLVRKGIEVEKGKIND